MRKSIVCALGAVMIGSMLTAPVEGYAAATKAADFDAVTISAPLINDGGFAKAKSPKLTKERKKLFKKALKGFVGSDITPVAYLGSQVVAGVNHRYLCRIKAVVPGAKEYYAFVTVFEDPDGNASITRISTTDAETNINGFSGGWFQASSAKVPKSLRTAFENALMGLVGVGYNPVAVLSQQVVAGMNYCLLCEAQVVYPDAPKYYTLVYLYVGLDGSSEISGIVRIADGSGNALAEIEPAEPEHSMKTLIVSVDENASKKKIKKIFKKLGLSIMYDYDDLNMYAVELAEETDEAGLNELIEKLEAYDAILSAEKDYYVTIY